MYNRVKIVPYKMGSDSAKKLQEGLRNLGIVTWRIKPERWELVTDNDLVIFWGSKDNVAANKLKFFQAAANKEGLNIPEWTVNPEEAKAWSNPDKRTEIVAFARTLLTSHSGNGIIPLSHGSNYGLGEGVSFPIAPLYVKYKKKTHEYRVHIFNGKAIDIVQKKRRAGVTEINNQIRNLNGGWVYCREDLEIADQDALILQATLACDVCELDFGAVDIIYNAHERKYYVLEVNTAPGLEGQTVVKYAEAIKSFMDTANEA